MQTLEIVEHVLVDITALMVLIAAVLWLIAGWQRRRSLRELYRRRVTIARGWKGWRWHAREADQIWKARDE